MPIKVGRKTYKSFSSAKRAASRKGVRNAAAYVAAIERAQGRDPRSGKRIRKVPTRKTRRRRKSKRKT